MSDPSGYEAVTNRSAVKSQGTSRLILRSKTYMLSCFRVGRSKSVVKRAGIQAPTYMTTLSRNEAYPAGIPYSTVEGTRNEQDTTEGQQRPPRSYPNDRG